LPKSYKCLKQSRGKNYKSWELSLSVPYLILPSLLLSFPFFLFAFPSFSLDFVVNRFFMKMFRTSNIEIVRNCQCYFGFKLPSELWSIRVEKFDVKYASCGGSFVNYGTNVT